MRKGWANLRLAIVSEASQYASLFSKLLNLNKTKLTMLMQVFKHKLIV